MMTWSIIGLIGPWLLGAAIVQRPNRGPAGWLLTIGAGWLLGQTIVMALLYLALRLTGASHARGIAVILAVAGAVLFVVNARRTMHTSNDKAPIDPTSPRTSRALIALLSIVLVASVVTKLGAVIPAVRDVPIRNDDAITFWLFKAKVIAANDHLSFEPNDPFYLGGSNDRYPVFLPIAAAFPALLQGEWSESAAAMLWLGFYLALPLSIAGALRLRLGAWPPALVAAYIVASLPLLSIHAYRPGYADLPLASFLCAGVLFALMTDRDPRPWASLGIAVAMLASAALMKREGIVLAGMTGLIVVVPRVVNMFRAQSNVRVAAVIAIALPIVAVSFVVDMRDVSEDAQALKRHFDVFPSLANHAFAWASFGPAFWLLTAAAVLILIGRRPEGRTTALVLLAALLGVDVCVFALTEQYVFALNDQTPSRLFLQVLPAIVVALTVPCDSMIRNRRTMARQPGEEANAGRRPD